MAGVNTTLGTTSGRYSTRDTWRLSSPLDHAFLAAFPPQLFSIQKGIGAQRLFLFWSPSSTSTVSVLAQFLLQPTYTGIGSALSFLY
ncbi:hypothetical protein BDY19DRAFT_204627 [Irpex rosettiformis]|uniref:Uncharacterized protein n=1 Tax=Irpex rosettiformis TaxID=378272 RepID=A0ACB8U1R1_9APHY|nr:hypothetical protein BDY19DRAFT_204627 [Irpex rosettiformis]